MNTNLQDDRLFFKFLETDQGNAQKKYEDQRYTVVVRLRTCKDVAERLLLPNNIVVAREKNKANVLGQFQVLEVVYIPLSSRGSKHAEKRMQIAEETFARTLKRFKYEPHYKTIAAFLKAHYGSVKINDTHHIMVAKVERLKHEMRL